MPARPLYRWKSFWLGIFIVFFLSWGWVRSQFHNDSVRATPAIFTNPGFIHSSENPYYTLRSSGGFVSWERTVGTIYSRKYGYPEFNSRQTAEPQWFPLPFSHEAATVLLPGDSYSYSKNRIAHWMTLLLFLIPWTTLLAWRWRKQRILTKAHDPATAP